MKIEEKIGKLEEYLRNKKSILGFSAGSDSTLLAYILSKVSPESLLVTINNNMMPKEFIEYTKTQAKKFNLKHKVINLDFLTYETFQKNTKERCYECRNKMYCNIQKLPEFNDYDYFIEGTNITDLLEDRPGILVLDKYNMISPLVECNITKEEVFNMINYLDLEYSYDTTCLATRVKTNQQVNREKLNKIYEAEKFVRKNIDQENIRVRTDKNNATISVDEPLKILDEKLIKNLRDKLQELGYSKVFLDITGYEKTELTYKIDKSGNYYYQLPYYIDIEKTFENLENKFNIQKLLKKDNEIYMEDMIIHEYGKISMNPTEKFIEQFYKILSCVKRNYYEK